MPRTRPATTGYERLAQADRFSDDSDDEGVVDASLQSSAAAAAAASGGSTARYGPITSHAPRPAGQMASSLPSGSSYRRPSYPPAGGSSSSSRRRRANSGVDLKAINARLERWADEITAKFKRHKKRGSGEDEERLEIHYSVFQAPEGVRPATAESLAQSAAEAAASSDVSSSVITQAQFEAIVESVRTAIRQGVHPRMISQGSSGSYFARNLEGKVVGVFKPKDEEPYAAGNPKWNKWIHRNLFPCCFGRACLIPNLSYVSEAAAYVLDAQLRTHMVPYTDVVYLSSKAFHYPFWDRYSHSRNRKPLPAKPGSFQVFLKGFKDANIFLREHPWPDQYLSGFRTSDRHRSGRRRRWADNCRPSSKHSSSGTPNGGSRTGNSSPNGGAGTNGGLSPGSGEYDYDEEANYSDYDDGGPQSRIPGPDNFVWTETLKQSFREELEKLVILDYIMRNTDRGLDNWMIKVDWSSQEVSIASEPMHLHMGDGSGRGDDDGARDEQSGPRPVDLSQRPAQETRARAPYPSYRAPKPMNASTPPADNTPQPKITIGAIDNSLSWPWKHPDAWRSFPFGWLFLPVDLIGRPFSQKTRDHFLPLLTSTAWWSQTQLALRRIFQVDPDFQERMFARQIAVMKGQAWNVVETLKTPDHGPLELTRRAKVCVWDDLVEVPIAVPMRATSSEIRRRAETELAKAMQEEMDIGVTAGGSSAQNPNQDNIDNSEDLLLSNATSPLPNPNRFELTKESVAEEAEEDEEGADGRGEGATGDIGSTPLASPTLSPNGNNKRKTSGSKPTGGAASRSRPSLLPRTSIGGTTGGSANTVATFGNAAAASSLNSTYTPQHQRRYSYTTAASRRNSNSIAQQLYGERMGGGSGSSAAAAAAAHPHHHYHHFRAASVDNYFYDDEVHPDEDIEGDLGYAAAEGMENNRRKVIVERLEPVKSKNPVFTWC